MPTLHSLFRWSRDAWQIAWLLLVLLSSQPTLRAQNDVALEPAAEHLIVVVGAAGSDEYDTVFSQWSQPWRELAAQRGWNLTLIGEQESPPKITTSNENEDASHLALLENAITGHQKSDDRLWLVLLGHGTYSGNIAKFNLVGPDVSAKDLSNWLKPITSPVVVINCSSSSGPFMTELAGANRVLITATRAGSEINFARFGKYLSQSLSDLAADVDHDLEVSLLEAFLAATAHTERFYREDARLITEHALLDDNGDRAGTSGDFFRGVRPVKTAAQGAKVDGAVAKRIILYSSPAAPQLTPELEQQRSAIEAEIDHLKTNREDLAEEVYLNDLEQLLLKMAHLYQAAE